tara:strand:+ start:121 stop:2214 length:2094 start_codon:yes stop_codon:yes gene_type:complete
MNNNWINNVEIRFAISFFESINRQRKKGFWEQIEPKIELFISNPHHSSFANEKITNRKSTYIWKARITRGIRLIFHLQHEKLVLLYVGDHKKAITWGMLKKFDEKTENVYTLPEFYEHLPKKDNEHLPFKSMQKNQLVSIGVPENWVPKIKTLDSANLSSIKGHLPRSVVSNLYRLKDGKDLKSLSPNKVDDLESTTDSTKYSEIIKIVDMSIINAARDSKWETWAVFQYPEQQELIEEDFYGPTKIFGSAGTGKTVMCIHRAVFLSKTNRDARILLTTATDHMKHKLVTMLEIMQSISEFQINVDVKTITELSIEIVQTHNNVQIQKITSQEIRDYIAKDRDQNEFLFEQIFIETEWTNVVDFFGLFLWDDYRDHQRNPKRQHLDPNEKEQLWEIFKKVIEMQKSRNRFSLSYLSWEAKNIIQDSGKYLYDHIIVDESQHLIPSQLKLVRHLVENKTNDIMLVGDAGQKTNIENYFWKQVGVHIDKDRIHTLDVNYRTTAEIALIANSIENEYGDGGDIFQEHETAIPIFNGEKPRIVQCESESEESKFLSEWISKLVTDIENPILPEDIAVFARTKQVLDKISKIDLSNKKIKRHDLAPNRTPKPGSVNFGTMDKSTGLEFKCVALIGCSNSIIPDNSILSDSMNDEDLKDLIQTEKNILYTALTRARDQLYISYTNQLTEYLLKYIKFTPDVSP